MALLGSMAERIGGELAEPVKTSVVQDQRAMTTWGTRSSPESSSPYFVVRLRFESGIGTPCFQVRRISWRADSQLESGDFVRNPFALRRGCAGRDACSLAAMREC